MAIQLDLINMHNGDRRVNIIRKSHASATHGSCAVSDWSYLFYLLALITPGQTDQCCMYPNWCLFVCGAIQPRRDGRYLRVNCLALQKAVAPRGPSGTETAYICINRDYDKEAWHIITLLRV